MHYLRRRTFLQTGLLATPLSGALAAPSPAAPKRGGKIIIRRSSAWTTMDPHLVTNVDPDYPLMFDYLTRYVRNASGVFEVVPGLAKSWNVVNDNTIDFTLQSNVLFHDGTPFTSKEAAWNLERMLTHPKSMAKSHLAGISRIEAVDPGTLRVHLERPNSALLVNLSSAADGLTAMLSMDHVKKVGDEQAGLKPIGTGPFRFVSWTPNQKVVYSRWDKYWEQAADKGRLPYPDGVETILQTNDQTAILRLRSGSFHIVDVIPGSQVDALKRVDSVKLVPTPWRANFFTLVFNARPGSKYGTAETKKIRQAVFAAIDKKAVAHAAGHGLGSPAFSPLVEGQVGYSTKVDKHTYDPAKARQLLKEAGVNGRLTINLSIVSRQDDNVVAQIYQQMLAQVGIDVVIQPQDKVTWVSRIRSGDFELASFFGRGRPDADGMLSAFYGAKGPTNYAGLKDPKIEELLSQGRATYDAAKRQTIYEQVQNVAHAHALFDFVWVREGAAAISKKITGYVPPFSGVSSDGTTVAFTA